MEDTYTSWRTLQSWDSIYSADSIEFCPLAPYQHVFLCGTYQLIQDKTETPSTDSKTSPCQRKGTLMLFSLNQTANSMELVRTVDTQAITDIKWSHRRVGGKVLFALVNTVGQIVVYELIGSLENSQDLDIHELSSYQLEPPEGASELLALSLDWSTRNHPSITDPKESGSMLDQIVVSDSQGWVHGFELTTSGLALVRSWKSHEFQAWIAAFNYRDPNIFYSGGDDCLMKVYDSRQSSPVRTMRGHDAGVTSIQCNPFKQHTIATGSYDEYVRLWDDRNLKCEKSRTHVGGGVWRIKHQPDGSILTATMYNGFHRLGESSRPDLEKPTEEASAQPLLHYHEHGDIAYGVDSCYGNPSYVVTCSFYNHLINLSLLENEGSRSLAEMKI